MRRAMVVWLSPSSVGGRRVAAGARDGQQHEQVVWARSATGQRRHGHPCILAHRSRGHGGTSSPQASGRRSPVVVGDREPVGDESGDRALELRRRRPRPASSSSRATGRCAARSSRITSPRTCRSDPSNLACTALRGPRTADSPRGARRTPRRSGTRRTRGARGAHRRAELHRRRVERARRGVRSGRSARHRREVAGRRRRTRLGLAERRRGRSRVACWCRRPDAAGRTRTRRSRAPCRGRCPAARAGRRGRDGTSPPCRSTISTAARCSHSARRG